MFSQTSVSRGNGQRLDWDLCDRRVGIGQSRKAPSDIEASVRTRLLSRGNLSISFTATLPARLDGADASHRAAEERQKRLLQARGAVPEQVIAECLSTRDALERLGFGRRLSERGKGTASLRMTALRCGTTRCPCPKSPSPVKSNFQPPIQKGTPNVDERSHAKRGTRAGRSRNVNARERVAAPRS